MNKLVNKSKFLITSLIISTALPSVVFADGEAFAFAGLVLVPISGALVMFVLYLTTTGIQKYISQSTIISTSLSAIITYGITYATVFYWQWSSIEKDNLSFASFDPSRIYTKKEFFLDFPTSWSGGAVVISIFLTLLVILLISSIRKNEKFNAATKGSVAFLLIYIFHLFLGLAIPK